MRSHTRNLLSDFDALLEAALRNAGDERCAQLTAEAVAIARDLALCGERDHKHPDFDWQHLERFIGLAVKALDESEFVKAQIYARTAKGYLRARVCQKVAESLSGRPVY